MSKILVTGATGRLGANVVKQLVERGDDVRALILPDDPKKSKLDSLILKRLKGISEMRRCVAILWMG